MSTAVPMIDFETLSEGSVREEVGPRDRAWSFVETKRIADCALAVGLLLLFLPFMVFAAIVI